MLISELNLTELGLTTVNDIPSAIKPECGDVWISQDDKLIVVTKVDDSSYYVNPHVNARINGQYFDINIKLWSMVLLSMRAVPVGKVKNQ